MIEHLIAVMRATELTTSLFMTGLIWFVQVVHYPLFALAGRGPDGTRYQLAHMRRTTWVVAAPMLAEAGAGVGLAILAVGPAWQRWPATVLLGCIWLATAAVLVPAHDELSRGFEARVHARLVAGNWIRTIAWTGRAGLAVAALTISG